MLFEILIAISCGIIFGIITGLIPGIHINLVCTFLLIIYSKYTLDPFIISILIISMAITHTFLDIIPSIYLGAPDPSLCELILPGHKMLLKGEGHRAVKLTLIGSYFSLVFSITLFYFYFESTKYLNEIVKGKIHIILIIVTLFIIITSKYKIKSTIVYLTAGVLGLSVFLSSTMNPLFHLFSGMFGLSGLIISLLDINKVPKQKFEDKRETNFILPSLTASIMGYFAAFFPGMGTSQVAVISSKIFKFTNEGFLILNGGLNTANMLLSLLTFYLLDKARNGAILAVQTLININFKSLLLFLLISLVVGSIAVIIGLKLSKIFARLIEKINYFKLVIIIISLITMLSFYLDGIFGVIILITSTALGIYTNFSGVPKNLMLGSISLQVIIYFL